MSCGSTEQNTMTWSFYVFLYKQRKRCLELEDQVFSITHDNKSPYMKTVNISVKNLIKIRKKKPVGTQTHKQTNKKTNLHKIGQWGTHPEASGHSWWKGVWKVGIAVDELDTLHCCCHNQLSVELLQTVHIFIQVTENSQILQRFLLPISPLSPKVVVCGHCLATLSLTINETLKWLSQLLILMQEPFWWWRVALGIASLFPNLLGSLSPPISLKRQLKVNQV